MDSIFLIGRILLGGYFLVGAYNHLFKSSNLVAYAEMKKVPKAKVAVIGSGLLLLFGGYSILTGVRVEAGISALVLFLIPVTFTMHAFWKEEGQARSGDQVQFINSSILEARIKSFSDRPSMACV